MSTSVDDAVAVGVVTDERELHVRMKDGRTISVPLDWFPRLVDASPDERADWRLIGAGEGIHWPQLDEDVSIAALLRGR
ncbi:DUF2442 domain-containing protein [Microbacterium sp. NPDC090281]|uniref:DUF2442 domain-containing protein n=1 Tax=unclassified Microbacterium TaxID=2609290 RepID=UPI000CFAC6EC|nr:DUF2442 domain-containing protein [Microbacterium sp. MYb62]PRB17390.1 hypothetical protein CQ042_06255 [Microbacterium sp. MYb62]